ncbi:MAG: PqiC family protein [Gammaproteobacteria bacterium]|nr:PqiC family protein [Gammaproteobacteria bacterium]
MLIRSGLFIMLVSLLGACSLSPANIPGDHFYRLANVQPAESDAIDFDHVLLKAVQVSGIYNERAMLFVERDRPLEIQRYHYHFWAETPSQLIYKQLRQHLLVRSRHVSSIANAKPADIVISPELLSFERITGNAIAVQVSLQMTVHYPSAPGKDWANTYSRLQPVGSSAMHATVQAYSTALDQLILNFLQDMGKK